MTSKKRVAAESYQGKLLLLAETPSELLSEALTATGLEISIPAILVRPFTFELTKNFLGVISVTFEPLLRCVLENNSTLIVYAETVKPEFGVFLSSSPDNEF